MNSTTEITEQTYIDSELNNLQTIVTHERFVESIAIVHLEEFKRRLEVEISKIQASKLYHNQPCSGTSTLN